MKKMIARRIFVQNVPEFYNETLIKDIFKAFGEIVQAKMIPARIPDVGFMAP